MLLWLKALEHENKNVTQASSVLLILASSDQAQATFHEQPQLLSSNRNMPQGRTRRVHEQASDPSPIDVSTSILYPHERYLFSKHPKSPNTTPRTTLPLVLANSPTLSKTSHLAYQTIPRL
ncbi:hypothetical protein Pst134EB_027674 [Puccinia striiformis f. sp. tritici]|nr:hypothetical protein Pst134EB_027674 [Puccinia striiformis f. sp. tritici]